jgi:hypothetical protein
MGEWAGVLAETFAAVAAGELDVDATDVARFAAVALRRVAYNVHRATHTARGSRRPCRHRAGTTEP